MGWRETRNRVTRAAGIAALAAVGAVAAAGCGWRTPARTTRTSSPASSCSSRSAAPATCSRAPGRRARPARTSTTRSAVARTEGWGDARHPRRRPRADPQPRRSAASCRPKLVTGEDAHDVAAYVAKVVARPGKDSGPAGHGGQGGRRRQAGGREGRRAVDRRRSDGQLAYVTKVATATAGPIEIQMPNESRRRPTTSWSRARDDQDAEIVQGGTAKASGDAQAGHLHVLLLGPRPPRGRHAGQAHRQVAAAPAALRADADELSAERRTTAIATQIATTDSSSRKAAASERNGSISFIQRRLRARRRRPRRRPARRACLRRLEDVDRREDDDPHHVDEVPVDARHLDALVGVRREVAAEDRSVTTLSSIRPIDDVRAVQAGQAVEDRALARGPAA